MKITNSALRDNFSRRGPTFPKMVRNTRLYIHDL